MNVQVENVGDVTILKPSGALDAGTSKQFKTEAAPVAAETRKLLVDLSALQIIDSSGLAVVLSLLR